jgi:hypothetical protein
MFDVVEDDGGNSDTNKTTPLDGFVFFDTLTLTYRYFFSVPVIFCGVDVFFFIMVLSMNDS